MNIGTKKRTSNEYLRDVGMALKVCEGAMSSKHFTLKSVIEMFRLQLCFGTVLREAGLAENSGAPKKPAWKWVYEKEVTPDLVETIGAALKQKHNEHRAAEASVAQPAQSPNVERMDNALLKRLVELQEEQVNLMRLMYQSQIEAEVPRFGS